MASYQLYYLSPSKKHMHKNWLWTKKLIEKNTKQRLSSYKMPHRWATNPIKPFYFLFKIENSACSKQETQVGDFKLKALDWLFVVVVV